MPEPRRDGRPGNRARPGAPPVPETKSRLRGTGAGWLPRPSAATLAGSFGVVAAVSAIAVLANLAPEDPQARPVPEAELPTPDRPEGAPGRESPLRPGSVHPEVLSVTDAVEVEGEWLVLDGRARRIHRLGKGGLPRTSFGGRGEGPGELASPGWIALVGKAIVVADRTRGRLDYFTPTGRFLRRVAIPPTGCIPAFVRGLAGLGEDVFLVRECLDGGRRVSRLEVWRPPGRLELLAEAGPVEPGPEGLDLLRVPVLTVVGETVVFGTNRDECLTRMDTSGDVAGVVCHGSLRRPPLPDAARRELEKIRERFPPGVPGRVLVPTRLPPFDRVFGAPGVIVYRVFTAGEAMALAHLSGTGEPRYLHVPAAASIHVGTTTVLASWDELPGTRLAVVPLELP